MRRNAVVLILAAALLGSGCNSELGREEPACDTDRIGTTIILAAQSVRGAAYVPCISDLKPGWTYEHLVAQSGRSRFWISSDRVGQRFLEVTFEGSCNTTGAVEEDSDEDQIPLFVDVRREDFHIRVTVVPEGNDETHIEYAAEIVSQISATRVEDRLVEARVDSSDLPTTERIRAALGQGRVVLVVGAREYEERTVELHRREPGAAGPTVVSGMSAEDAVEEVAEALGRPAYEATWYYPFENGCVTYEFDAEGAGAERIARDVQTSFGFIDMAPIREYGDQVGFVIP